ncbi:MAG: class I SAM-dependent methyltransferase [Nostoc sp.]|uniref:class I SAM-dependent methyltransferase n=1 Tax=Nostoc sp. TaxID=1180 RepID=UPI002FF01BDA
MIEKEIYTNNFFKNLQQGAEQSARKTIPFVLDLVQPKSVVDVGCGNGIWLSVFKEFGIQEILGIDGNYVDPAILLIQEKDFFSHDLKRSLQLDREFDLVVSLEVAEHLPSDYAEIFIKSLTSLGSVVMFSAAIPFQGGDGHHNEQWPEYWVEIFKKRGFVVIDCLRAKLWDQEKVEAYYAQNIFLFVKEDCLKKYPLLENFKNAENTQLSIVHPEVFLSVVNWVKTKLNDSNSIDQAAEDILNEILLRNCCLDFCKLRESINANNEFNKD